MYSNDHDVPFPLQTLLHHDWLQPRLQHLELESKTLHLQEKIVFDLRIWYAKKPRSLPLDSVFLRYVFSHLEKNLEDYRLCAVVFESNPVFQDYGYTYIQLQ